jgi:hypothetical protein
MRKLMHLFLSIQPFCRALVVVMQSRMLRMMNRMKRDMINVMLLTTKDIEDDE